MHRLRASKQGSHKDNDDNTVGLGPKSRRKPTLRARAKMLGSGSQGRRSTHHLFCACTQHATTSRHEQNLQQRPTTAAPPPAPAPRRTTMCQCMLLVFTLLGHPPELKICSAAAGEAETRPTCKTSQSGGPAPHRWAGTPSAVQAPQPRLECTADPGSTHTPGHSQASGASGTKSASS